MADVSDAPYDYGTLAYYRYWRARHGPITPHEPIAWRRARTATRAPTRLAWFGRYSANSMVKWAKLRGHVYEVFLANGQMVRVRAK
jgi:hypothetical protein